MLRRLLFAIAWLYRMSKGSGLLIVLTTCLGIVQVAFSLSAIWITQKLIDAAVVSGDSVQVLSYSIVLVAVYLLLLVCDATRSLVQEKARATLVKRTKDRVFEQLLQSPVSGRKEHHTVDLVSRVETDLQRICDALSCTFPSLIIAAIHLLGAICFICLLDWHILIFLLLLIPFFMLLARYALRIMHRENHLLRKRESAGMSFLQEHLLHRNTLISLRATDGQVKTYASLMQGVYDQAMKKVSYAIASHTILQLGVSIAYVATLLWGVDAVSKHEITFGALTAFLQLVRHVQQPFVALGGDVSRIPSVLVAVERLSEIVSWDKREDANDVSLVGSLGVRLQNVDFGYADMPERMILQHLSYTFTPASFHLVVGETGSGKSTLIKLILGILQPNAGRIEVFANQSYYPCTDRLRTNFIYVPQGNTLQSGTIRSNLLLANATVSDIAIQQALYASVAEFVYDLPDGLDTACGEAGFGLSEGECQRIAIARALLQPGSILLLDEPTSALDSKTERLFYERLQAVSASKTVILVTHRQVPAGVDAHVFRMPV